MILTFLARGDHKNNETTIDVVEDLDLVMSMYNLLEYSSNYSDTAGTLWFNFREIKLFKSFKYKTG